MTEVAASFYKEFYFSKEVEGKDGYISIYANNLNKFIYVDINVNGNQLTPSIAKRLRDTLIEAYPLENAVSYERNEDGNIVIDGLTFKPYNDDLQSEMPLSDTPQKNNDVKFELLYENNNYLYGLTYDGELYYIQGVCAYKVVKDLNYRFY